MRKRLKNSSNTDNLIRIDPSTPKADLIQRAVVILEHDGVLVFPTTGLYGLGAAAFSSAAVDRVFRIKRRPADKPVLVMVADRGSMGKVVRGIPEHARGLLELWPGGITFVCEAADGVSSKLTGGTGKIGVRMPAHPVAKALVETFGGAITATSANLSGRPAPARLMDLDPVIRTQVDLILDAGNLLGGHGSTVLDVTCRPVKMIREGAIKRPMIEGILRSS